MTTFTATGSLQFYFVAVTGEYELEVDGAQGGAGGGQLGGKGAAIGGDFYLQAGSELEIIVGSMGGSGKDAGGGGGGSFVVDEFRELGPYGLVLAVAGGGGGGGSLDAGGGGVATAGIGGNGSGSDGGVGGSGQIEGAGGGGTTAGGGGGGGGETGGAGGGDRSAGSSGEYVIPLETNPTYFGGAGGSSSAGAGGFGGGGGAGAGDLGGGGGGGGYGGTGGGGGGGGATGGGGGGGASYLVDGLGPPLEFTNITKVNDANSGDGFVTVQLLSAAPGCYCNGTLILTARGETAVEALRVGDFAVTVSGALRPIRWIGSRRIDISRHPDPATVWPVRVSAGAFGVDRPRRDLYLSPGHNIASEGALMPISCLINGRSVARIEQNTIEYWHVELDAHDIVLAEGLPAESYLDCGNRAAFVNGGAFIDAHPDFKARYWAETCLPLVKEGPEVVQTKARLIARLAYHGCDVCQEADAHLVVDGLRVEPIRFSNARLAFVLPASAQDITLRSNVFIPAHTVAECADSRELGLCVRRLQVDGMALRLDDEVCMPGWHAAELADGRVSYRWTKGVTPLASGARIVIVDLAGAGHYWRDAGEDVLARFA